MSSSLVQENDGATELTSGDINALREIVEGTAESTGEAFFQSLVEHLAAAIQVQYAFVAEFAQAPTRVRTLAYWTKDRIAENIEFKLAGTPCEEVIAGSLCHHPAGVQERFPQDAGLIDLGIQSYLGVPLVDAEGQVLGHLAVFDMSYANAPAAAKQAAHFPHFCQPRSQRGLQNSTFRMEQMLKESEKAVPRFVRRGADPLRFRRHRHAVCPRQPRGDEASSACVPPDVQHGRQLVAGGHPLLDNQLRLRARPLRPSATARNTASSSWSFAARTMAGRFGCSSGRVRSRTAKHTRTMIIDITDRVLAQRERARLQQQNLYLQEEINASRDFQEIVGLHPALAAVLENVRRGLRAFPPTRPY